MRILIITDLHIGRPSDAQRDAINSLVDDIFTCFKPDEIDAVALLGDIAWSGTEPEYDNARLRLVDPLLARMNVPLIVVPGNHDLDCSNLLPVDWSRWGKRRENFFASNQDGVRLRSSRTAGMRDFGLFARTAGAHTVAIDSEAASLHVINGCRGPNAFVIANTALFADSEPGSETPGVTPAPTPALREPLRRAREAVGAGPVLVLGHHPISWFLADDQERLRSLLSEHRAVYLHGHVHLPQAAFGPAGLESLGFGAGYQAPLDAPPGPYYRNAYAVVDTSTSDYLCVRIREWSSEYGRWYWAANLPATFTKEPAVDGGYRFALAAMAGASVARERGGIDPETVRILRMGAAGDPSPSEDAITNDTPEMSRREWGEWLEQLHLTRPGAQLAAGSPITDEGRQSLVYKGINASYAFDCIAASGHVLSRAEIEAANNRLDYDDHASLTIVSVGGIAEDAKIAYLRFRKKKDLEVVAGAELAKRISRHRSQSLGTAMQSYDSARFKGEYLYVPSIGAHVLISELPPGSQRFLILDPHGVSLPANSEVVRALRQQVRDLARRHYIDESGSNEPAELLTPRDEHLEQRRYLEACRREFDNVRYPGLATVGVRFQNVTLSEVYIEASGEVDCESAAEAAIADEIQETVGRLDLEGAQRAQMEAQLFRLFRLGTDRETELARVIYQRHGSLVVIGDPGSGKTCFVKNEIVSYAASAPNTWYANHIPVYASLADVARIFSAAADDSDRDGPTALVPAVCQALRDRGIQIDPSELCAALEAGRAAIFFDGLDEIPSLKQRTELCHLIGEMTQKYAGRGCRFVLTTRPAAIQGVTLPRELRTLTLKGLTEKQIGLLARNILRTRYSSEGSTDELHRVSLGRGDESVVDQLLSDVRAVRGIGRLARNPLLLTLLVTLYASGGRPASRRHRLYAQAVQVLAAVRSRESNQQPISESDLRIRLGGVALRAFESEDGIVVSRAQVCTWLAEIMSKQLRRPVPMEESSQFLDNVAVVTGLLTFQTDRRPEDCVVAFMHHSFFEYYAAVGLLQTSDYLERLPDLCLSPKWHEVLLLASGMIGDSSEVTPVVERLVGVRSDVEALTLQSFLFAFDCALEVDVPSESVQAMLLDRIALAVEDGSLRYDVALREQVGRGLQRLWESTSSNQVASLFGSGLAAVEAWSLSAYIELLGFTFADVEVLPDPLGEALVKLFSREQQIVQLGLLNASCRCKALHLPGMGELAKRSLRASTPLQLAALKLIGTHPGFGVGSWELILKLFDANHPVVARAAASAALSAGMVVELGERRQPAALNRVLRQLERPESHDVSAGVRVRTELEDLVTLLESPNPEDRVLGLRLLPWHRLDDRFVHERLMKAVDDAEPEERVVALRALARNAAVLGLMRYRDIDKVRLLLVSNRRDLRMSAANVLSELGDRDPSMAIELIAYAKRVKRGVEYREALQALRNFAPDHLPDGTFVESEIKRLFLADGMVQRRSSPSKGRHQPGWSGANEGSAESGTEAEVDAISLLELVSTCGTGVSKEVTDRIRQAAIERRNKPAVRHAAYRALSRTWEPSAAAADFWIRAVNNAPAGEIATAICIGIREFAAMSRRQFDYVRRIYHRLPQLRAAVIRLYARIGTSLFRESESTVFVHLRLAVEELDRAIRVYQELAALPA